MNCRRGGSAGRVEAGRVEAGARVEAGRVEAGARAARVTKVALLTRARDGCPVGIFACAGLARWTNGKSAEPPRRGGMRPPFGPARDRLRLRQRQTERARRRAGRGWHNDDITDLVRVGKSSRARRQFGIVCPELRLCLEVSARRRQRNLVHCHRNPDAGDETDAAQERQIGIDKFAART